MRWDKTLCAVEVKIGAALRDHQNPGREAFSKRDGYGYLTSRRCRESGCKGRYVVFGWAKEVMPWTKDNALGLDVGQRNWADLENGLPASTLTSDLTSLLSSFGVWEFTFRAMKNKKLSGK